MKVRAGRNTDEDDIKILLRELEVRTPRQLREIHDAVFPHDAIPWRKEASAVDLIRQVLEEDLRERARHESPGEPDRPRERSGALANPSRCCAEHCPAARHRHWSEGMHSQLRLLLDRPFESRELDGGRAGSGSASSIRDCASPGARRTSDDAPDTPSQGPRRLQLSQQRRGAVPSFTSAPRPPGTSSID